MKRTWLWTAVIMVVAVVVGCARTSGRPAAKHASSAAAGGQARKADVDPKTVDQTTKTPPVQAVGNEITISWDEKGKKSMVATAKEMVANTAAGTAVMKHVSVKLFSGGRQTATLTAPDVIADQKSRIVTATGGVVITSSDPKSSIKTIKAPRVKWYSRENKIVGDGGIKARGAVASIDAAAFIADTRLRTVRILSNPAEARAVIERH